MLERKSENEFKFYSADTGGKNKPRDPCLKKVQAKRTWRRLTSEKCKLQGEKLHEGGRRADTRAEQEQEDVENQLKSHRTRTYLQQGQRLQRE